MTGNVDDSKNRSDGPATDRNNAPVIDPTKNVLDLVDAAVTGLKNELTSSVQRLDDLRTQEARHLKDREDLRAFYDHQLRQAETARIDAIRAVDVGAVQRASEVANQQATTLAAQVAASAETLRTQVAAAASAATIALAAALEPVQKDIADLRRVQYEGVGSKTQVVESRGAQGNLGLWIGLAVSVVIGGLGTLIGIAGLVFAFLVP